MAYTLVLNYSVLDYLMRRSTSSTDQRLAMNAWVKLARAANAVGSRLARRLAEYDLTESQFGVLDALFHLGPLHQRDLAKKILRTTGNVTLVVDNLEQRELVQRERGGADRRYVRVCLTPAGEALIGKVFPRHAVAVATELAVLSSEEHRQLTRLCRRLVPTPGSGTGS
jgi:MarR family 2-MHQ and catechol resistance regulon transcriptional repressor